MPSEDGSPCCATFNPTTSRSSTASRPTRARTQWRRFRLGTGRLTRPTGRRILADDSAIARAIVEQGEVVGNVGSWVADGERLIGYWIGREHWGRGIATRAVADLVAEIAERPVHACVVEHNRASIRVLEKCGFEVVGTHQPSGEPFKEILLRLDAA